MVRILCVLSVLSVSIPHPRGDGPKSSNSGMASAGYSPPAWGWSVLWDSSEPIPTVFPTRVGMVRNQTSEDPKRSGIPHPRGDGPSAKCTSTDTVRYSPPAWGWSGESRSGLGVAAVFPTRVGMVRKVMRWPWGLSSIPHPRGDGPSVWLPSKPPSAYSPPAWGWSGHESKLQAYAEVFPTRVGMVRLPPVRPGHQLRIPHPRGDGPSMSKANKHPNTYSPPAWGWSAMQFRPSQQ